MGFSIRLRSHQTRREIDGATVTLESRAVIVAFATACLVWNRPTAIVVEDGSSRRTSRVVDVTRIAQGTLLATALLASIALWKQGRERHHE